MPEQLTEQFTVIFLGDQLPPTKLVMLKRESSRYGGGLYTGIGGHFEPDKDSDMKSSTERELAEEVPDFTDVSLIEFARCIVNGQKGLSYFTGIVNHTTPLPLADAREGTIEWISIPNLFDLNIFPTTRPILEEWQRRKFSTTPWTMYVIGTEDKNRITRNVIVERIEEGLASIL